MARNLIFQQYPKIFNIKCIAYCLNLISHDILEHRFANKTLRYCNTLVTYFKKSHICDNLLEKIISEKQISGGGLKTYVKTHWITMTDCANSILCLKLCLLEVSIII